MNRQIMLSFAATADFLKKIYPDQNWTLFLTKNLHGLTEGYARIHCDMNARDVVYWLGEIEHFAVLYGKGSPSADEIEALCNRYASQLELQSLCHELSASDPFGISGKFLDEAKHDADGNLVFSTERVSELLIAINDLANTQLETGYALTTLAQAFRGVGAGVHYSQQDATALAEVAVRQAGCAIDNADSIRGLFN